MHRPQGAHAAAALGAARLAGLADGASEEAVCQPLALEQGFEPDPQLSQLLAERYPRYRVLYRAL
jgi:xylulokinase